MMKRKEEGLAMEAISRAQISMQLHKIDKHTHNSLQGAAARLLDSNMRERGIEKDFWNKDKNSISYLQWAVGPLSHMLSKEKPVAVKKEAYLSFDEYID